jgi:hypothetical protein
VPTGWAKINICHISFYAPPDLKDSGINGMDSCAKQFANNEIVLYLDYGIYGEPATARGSKLEWKQESRSVGGRLSEAFVEATGSAIRSQTHRCCMLSSKPVKAWSRMGMTQTRKIIGNLGQADAMRR